MVSPWASFALSTFGLFTSAKRKTTSLLLRELPLLLAVEGPAVVAVAVEGPAAAATESVLLIIREVAEQNRQLDVTRKQDRWMFCYREGMSYASINSNNYIKSWGNALKQHFFREKQKRRVDTMIFVLKTMAVPHYQSECMRSLVKVGKMNPAQKEERKHLDKIKEFVEAMGETGPTTINLRTTW